MASRERAEAVMRQDWEYLKNFEAGGISCDLACARNRKLASMPERCKVVETCKFRFESRRSSKRFPWDHVTLWVRLVPRSWRCKTPGSESLNLNFFCIWCAESAFRTESTLTVFVWIMRSPIQ